MCVPYNGDGRTRLTTEDLLPGGRHSRTRKRLHVCITQSCAASAASPNERRLDRPGDEDECIPKDGKLVIEISEDALCSTP